MKPNDVRRSVRSQRFVRSAGDAPSIGRVGRMPGTGIPKGERRVRKRGERRGGGGGNRTRLNHARVVITWSLVMVLVVVVGLGVALNLWLKTSGDKSRVRGAGDELILERRVASEFASPSEDGALELVRGAMALRDPAEVEDYFRLGGRDADQAIDFLRKMEETDGELTGYSWLSSMDANGMLLDGVLMSTVDEGRVRNRLVLLTPDEKGVWRIDFDAFARAVEPSWDEIKNGLEGEALVRVIIANDSYFNGPFRDEASWRCFAMASPDIDETLLGYAAKGSAQASALEEILKSYKLSEAGKPMKRATLKLRRRDGSGARQFEITRVLAEDWAVSGEPLDGGAP